MLRQDHVDNLALLEARWPDRQIDEAVRKRHRAKDSRALRSGEPDGALLWVVNATSEETKRPQLVDLLAQSRLGPRPRNVRASLHPKQRRADEDLERDESGDGVARHLEARHTTVAVCALAEL